MSNANIRSAMQTSAHTISDHGKNFYRIDAYEALKETFPIKITSDINFGTTWCCDDYVLIENPNDPPTRVIYEVDGVDLYIDNGAVVVVEENVWLKAVNGGRIICQSGAKIILEPSAELICDPGGFLTDNSADIRFLGQGACLATNGGTLTFSQNVSRTVDNEGLIAANNNGVIELKDNARLIFKAGANFTADPGATFKFGQNARIDMYGKMLAQGNAGNPITFTSDKTNPSPGDWRGINFFDSADDASIIEYAVMEYARTGLWLNSASPTIRHNTLRNGHLYNLRLDYSTALIEDNIIENSNLISGVYARFSDATFDNNTIRNHAKDGMYLYQSNPVMINNTVSNNTRYGIYCYGYSSPQLGTSTTQQGKNLITNNSEGIHAYNNSNPFLGLKLGSKTVGGYNSIKSNSAWGVSATSNSNIQAEYNWWGHYPVVIGDVYSDGTSSVDYSPEMTFDPGAGASKMLTIGNPGFDDLQTGGSEIFGQNPKGGDTYDVLLWLARKYRGKKQFRYAIRTYKKVMNDFANTAAAQSGVMELINTYREAGLDSVLT